MLVKLEEPVPFKLRVGDTQLTSPVITFEGDEGTYHVMVAGCGLKLLKASGYAVRIGAEFVPYELQYMWPHKIIEEAGLLEAVITKRIAAEKPSGKKETAEKPKVAPQAAEKPKVAPQAAEKPVVEKEQDVVHAEDRTLNATTAKELKVRAKEVGCELSKGATSKAKKRAEIRAHLAK